LGVQWDKLALLITKGDIPQAVERRLGTLRKPPTLEPVAPTKGRRRRGGGTARNVNFPFASVSATPDPSTGSMVLSAASWDRLYAVQMANLFTTEMLKYLNNVGQERYDADLVHDSSLRASLQSRVNTLDAQIAGTSDPNTQAGLVSQRDAALKQIDSV